MIEFGILIIILAACFASAAIGDASGHKRCYTELREKASEMGLGEVFDRIAAEWRKAK